MILLCLACFVSGWALSRPILRAVEARRVARLRGFKRLAADLRRINAPTRAPYPHTFEVGFAAACLVVIGASAYAVFW